MKPILTVLALLAAAGMAQAQQDIVKLRDNTEVKCKITALTSQSVMYTDASNKPVVKKRDDVLDVVLGDTSKSLKVANEAAAAGNYEKANNFFNKALEEVKAKQVRELQKEFIYWNMALTSQTKKEFDAALATLKLLRAECKDCWFRIDSYRRGLAIAQQMSPDKGEPATVEILDEMQREPDPVGTEARLELGKLKYRKGAFEDANGIFGALSAPEAKLWSIRCLRQLKKFDELEGMCATILSDRTSSNLALLQAAGTTLGQAKFKKAEKDDKILRDALMAFAQAVAVGPPMNVKDDGEDHAMALIGAARCYVKLSNLPTTKEAAKNEYREKAKDYLKDVTRVYRNTDWAANAQKEISELDAASGPK